MNDQSEDSSVNAPGDAAPSGSVTPTTAPAGNRNRWARPVILTVILAAAAAAYVFVQRTGADFPDWGRDLDAALKRAREEHRPLLAYFVRSTNAEDVKWMANSTLARKDNRNAINDARFVRVLVETSVKSDLASRYGLKKLPTMMVLSSEGVEHKRSDKRIGEIPFRRDFLEPSYEGWETDLEAALTRGRREGVCVLVLFTGEPSSPKARRLFYAGLTSSPVQGAVEQTGCIRVRAALPGKQPLEHPSARAHELRALPTLVLIPQPGEPRKAEGFLTPGEILEFLNPPEPPARRADHPIPAGG